MRMPSSRRRPGARASRNRLTLAAATSASSTLAPRNSCSCRCVSRCTKTFCTMRSITSYFAPGRLMNSSSEKRPLSSLTAAATLAPWRRRAMPRMVRSCSIGCARYSAGTPALTPRPRSTGIQKTVLVGGLRRQYADVTRGPSRRRCGSRAAVVILRWCANTRGGGHRLHPGCGWSAEHVEAGRRSAAASSARRAPPRFGIGIVSDAVKPRPRASVGRGPGRNRCVTSSPRRLLVGADAELLQHRTGRVRSVVDSSTYAR